MPQSSIIAAVAAPVVPRSGSEPPPPPQETRGTRRPPPRVFPESSTPTEGVSCTSRKGCDGERSQMEKPSPCRFPPPAMRFQTPTSTIFLGSWPGRSTWQSPCSICPRKVASCFCTELQIKSAVGNRFCGARAVPARDRRLQASADRFGCPIYRRKNVHCRRALLQRRARSAEWFN